MSVANRYVGKDLYAEFICAAGTIALTGDQRTLTVERSVDTVDISAGSETDKSYLATLKDGTAEVELMDQASVVATGIEASMPEGTSGTLLYAPKGTSVGNPKRGFVAIVTGVSLEYPYSDAVVATISFQKSGAVLYGGTAQY